jgi:hypothetical protein
MRILLQPFGAANQVRIFFTYRQPKRKYLDPLTCTNIAHISVVNILYLNGFSSDPSFRQEGPLLRVPNATAEVR